MNCQSLSMLPDDVFFQVAYGSLGTISPSRAIGTLCQLSAVSKQLKEKVDRCWHEITKQSEFIAYFYPLAQQSAPREAHEFIKQHHKEWGRIDLKKWADVSPTYKEKMIEDSHSRFFTYDLQGHPVVWNLDQTGTTFVCYNLNTQETSTLQLSEEINQFPYNGIGLSKKWLARSNDKEILIFDRLTGKKSHTITCGVTIWQLQCEEEYLYVLCSGSGKRQLIRFDGQNWDATPVELNLPSEVNRFCLGPKYIFLYGKPSLIIQKEHCFSKATKSTIITLTNVVFNSYVRPKPSGDGFLIADHKNIIKKVTVSEDLPVVEIFQDLCDSSNKTVDFYTHLNRLFIITVFYRRFNVLCYDLTTKSWLKRVSPSLITMPIDYACNPEIVSSAPGRIQVIYSSEASQRDPENLDYVLAKKPKKSTAIWTLDFTEG